MGDVKVASVSEPQPTKPTTPTVNLTPAAPVAVVASVAAAAEETEETAENGGIDAGVIAASTTMCASAPVETMTIHPAKVAHVHQQETVQREEAVECGDENASNGVSNGTATITVQEEEPQQKREEGESAAATTITESELQMAEDGHTDAVVEGASESAQDGTACDTESDGVEIAPVGAPTQEIETRIPSSPATTSVEGGMTPEVVGLDGEQPSVKLEVVEKEEKLQAAAAADDKAELVTELAGAEASSVNGGESVSTQIVRRRKKTRTHFSSTRNRNMLIKQKRQSLSIIADPMVDPSHTLPPAAASSGRRGRRRLVPEASPETPPCPDTTTTGMPVTTASSDAVTWNWDSCSLYYEPLTQTIMNDMTTLRRQCASIVVANENVWTRMRRFASDESFLESMVVDATETRDHLQVRAVRRGRHYRDVWEEEDFLQSQQKPPASSRPGKKRPFAGCEVLRSGRDLVRGYDDIAFRAYLARLEDQLNRPKHTDVPLAQEPANVKNGLATASRRIDDQQPRRRLRTAQRRTLDMGMLPGLAVHELHPASCGSWKLKGKDSPSFDTIHPASIRSVPAPQRWAEEWVREEMTQKHNQTPASAGPRRSGRHDDGDNVDDATADEDEETKSSAEEIASDDVVELPSFGRVVEEDEISREIDNSLTRLIEVSALNWRNTQKLYDRAVSHIEVAPLLQAEQAAHQRLEELYKKLYPTVVEDSDDDDEDEESRRELKLTSRPRDLVNHAVNSCGDLTESVAVGASVEYAMRVSVGFPIDVLDRNGLWCDGVVTQLRKEGDNRLKDVLVSCATWGDGAVEWVGITEGRLLPRGVADGRVSFTMPTGRGVKRQVELTTDVADVLQRTYQSRQAAQQLSRGSGKAKRRGDLIKTPGKKQRRTTR